jgi:hypothetical protein
LSTRGNSARLLAHEDEAAGRALIARALILFEEMDATGWPYMVLSSKTPQQCQSRLLLFE